MHSLVRCSDRRRAVKWRPKAAQSPAVRGHSKRETKWAFFGIWSALETVETLCVPHLAGHNIFKVSRLTDTTCPVRVWRHFEPPTDARPCPQQRSIDSKKAQENKPLYEWIKIIGCSDTEIWGSGTDAEKDASLLRRHIAELHIGANVHSVVSQTTWELSVVPHTGPSM